MIRDLTIFTPPLPLGELLTRLPLPPGEGWGEGSRGKVCQLIGDELNSLIEPLNESLAA
jgi:hypothetical protein